MGEVYRGAFTKTDLISAATKTTVAGEYVRLGVYTVQAGEIISIGYGMLSGQDNAVGRIYMDLKDGSATPAALNGTVRLSAFSAQDRPQEILFEARTEAINNNGTDRTKQMPFPEHDLWLTEDKKLVLEFCCDTAATLTKANCTILMDITRGVA
jgi:hypothetical protein